MRFFPWNSDTDGLSLDLQFATDKSLTARKGPTPTFTRASTATFIGSDGLIQSAAINVARFAHDPVTLESKGLLIEESRTNLVLQSENHPSATWNKTGLTIASASNTDPAGAATSNLVTEDVSVGLHRLFLGTAFVSGTSYSISVFLKYAGRQFVAITHPTVAANNVAIFDIQNGTITLSGSSVTSSITAYPNGWYRCVVTGTSSTTGNSSHVIQGSTTGGILTGSYLGLNGPAFYIYGSQVEAGAFPTSYIPTTTAAVVRSVDLCTITGADFTTVYNESEHSMFVEASGMSHAGFPSYLSFDNSLSAEQSSISGYPSVSRVVCVEVDGGTTFASIQLPVTLNQNNKMAAAMKLNSFQLSLNGTLGTEDTSGTMATATSFKIGRNWGSVVLSGTYKQVKVFKKRLPNAKLQALTALVSDLDASAYIGSLLAAGATVTESQQNAINTFYQTGKADGWYSSLKRLYLPIWGVASPNAIDMIGLTSGTFVGGVTHASGYVQGNGTSGSLLLNANLPTMGVGHTNIAIGGLCYIAPTLLGRNLFSSFDSVSQMIDLLYPDANTIKSRIGSFFAAGEAALVTANAAAQRGVIIGSYDGTSRFIKIRRSGGITTGTGLSAATGATPASTPRFMVDSRNVSGWSDAGYGAFYISSGLTTSNADSFITAIENLWEGTTGLTLP